MKKLSILALITLLAVVTVTIGLKHNKSAEAQHETLAQAESEAKQESKLPACLDLQTQNEPNQSEAKAISDEVGANLIRKPKTIAYSVYYKTFNTTKATGTIIYDGNAANTFNFVVNRANKAGVWNLSSFEACK